MRDHLMGWPGAALFAAEQHPLTPRKSVPQLVRQAFPRPDERAQIDRDETRAMNLTLKKGAGEVVPLCDWQTDILRRIVRGEALPSIDLDRGRRAGKSKFFEAFCQGIEAAGGKVLGQGRKPKPVPMRLTAEWQRVADEFRSTYGDGNCSCHLSAPCGSCTHEGHPLNLENTPEAWERDE